MIVTLGVFFILLQAPTPEAIEHAQAGAAAEQAGRYDKAIAEFRKETEIAPALASGYASLGGVYFRKGDYNAAIPVLQHALQLSPDLTATHQILGVALLIEGNAAGALPHLQKAPEPELLGLAYSETHQLGPALTSFQAALAKKPEDPDLLYYFGHAAAAAAQQAFDRYPEITDAPLPAELKVELADLEPIEKALIEKPDDPARLGRFARATAFASRQAFEQLAAKHPDSARAHLLAAERFTADGKIPDAEKEYQESIRLEPGAAGVHLAFGKLLVMAGDYAHAIGEFHTEAELRPLGADAFLQAGSTLMQLGRPKEALPFLVRADQLAPGNQATLLALSRAAAAAGDAHLAERAMHDSLHAPITGDTGVEARQAIDSLNHANSKKP